MRSATGRRSTKRAQRPQARNQEPSRKAVGRGQPHGPRRACVLSEQLPFDGERLRLEIFDSTAHRFTRGGEQVAIGGAIEQARASGGFERGEPTAHRGLVDS